MPAIRLYEHRGSLSDCILALVARSGTIGDSHLAIVANDKSRYYGLVTDDFLRAEPDNPNEGEMRLVLRVTDSELKQFHDVFETLQGDMFK